MPHVFLLKYFPRLVFLYFMARFTSSDQHAICFLLFFIVVDSEITFLLSKRLFLNICHKVPISYSFTSIMKLYSFCSAGFQIVYHNSAIVTPDNNLALKMSLNSGQLPKLTSDN